MELHSSVDMFLNTQYESYDLSKIIGEWNKIPNF